MPLARPVSPSDSTDPAGTAISRVHSFQNEIPHLRVTQRLSNTAPAVVSFCLFNHSPRFLSSPHGTTTHSANEANGWVLQHHLGRNVCENQVGPIRKPCLSLAASPTTHHETHRLNHHLSHDLATHLVTWHVVTSSIAATTC